MSHSATHPRNSPCPTGPDRTSHPFDRTHLRAPVHAVERRGGGDEHQSPSAGSGWALDLRGAGDERLARLAVSGSGADLEAAFAEVARRYRDPLHRYCARLIGSGRAEDAVQQALLQAFVALRDGGRRQVALRPWLYRIARNCAVDLLRSDQGDHEQLDPAFDGVPQPPRILEQKESIGRLVAGIQALPDGQRQALTLREFEGRSYEEISARLGQTRPGVRQLIFRARTALRRSAGAGLALALVAGAAQSACAAPAQATARGAGAVLRTSAQAGPEPAALRAPARPAARAGTASPACRDHAPRDLRFERRVGEQRGLLRWRAPRGRSPARYRVYRNGRVIGQTTRRAMRMAVAPGRRYTFSVRTVSSSGAAGRCAASLRRTVSFRAPQAPTALAARAVTDDRVTLEWLPGRQGDGRIAGYRVYRNNAVHRQVHGLSAKVRVSPAREYEFRVAAADTRGNVGASSRPLRVRSGHYPPGAPGGPAAERVTDREVGLRWAAARRRSAPIAGYRLYRDGVPVGQFNGVAAGLENLAAATTYRFTVAAVDTLGYLGNAGPATAVTTAMPPPTQGRVHAFLLATTDASFVDLQRHYRRIGTLYPTYFDCRADGRGILGADDALVTGWARLRRIAVLPRLNCQRTDTLHTILTDPSARVANIDRIVALVQAHGYDGINLDFEAGLATDRDALTSFVSAVAARLHALGKRISVEVSPKYRPTTTGRSGFYDYQDLVRVADWVFVMNWGWHWSTSGPGAPDDLSLTTRVADYVATMPSKQRFVLGTHLYGMDWPNGGGPSNRATALEYADVQALIARYRAVPVRDPVSDSWHFTYTDPAGSFHEVWYADGATVGNRVRLAKDRGLGIGFWRLGAEDQRLWSDPLLAPGSAWP